MGAGEVGAHSRLGLAGSVEVGMCWVLVEGCSLTAYASSAPRCAATAGIVTLCACQAVMPNRSVLRAMRPESPAVISISRAAVLCARGKTSAASSDLSEWVLKSER